MLKLENIKGGYAPGSMVLQGIDLEIAPGEVVGIIGLNGCGKSTLGKAVLNLLPYREGRIVFNGNDISKFPVHRVQQAGISMMMQGGRIFRHMTVLEHLQVAGNTRDEKETKKNLEDVELFYGITNFISDNLLKQRGSYLSGGEKQKLALAMTLINKPRFLILDEVSAGIAPANMEVIAGALEKLKARRSPGIILIEQNLRLAARLSDRLILLERGIIDREFKIDVSFDLNKLNDNIFN